jgi:hypothetical protein
MWDHLRDEIKGKSYLPQNLPMKPNFLERSRSKELIFYRPAATAVKLGSFLALPRFLAARLRVFVIFSCEVSSEELVLAPCQHCAQTATAMGALTLL